MTGQLPRAQTGMAVVPLGNGIYFDVVPISFDGNHSFSFAGWFRLGPDATTGALLGTQAFTFGINASVLYAQFSNQATPVVSSEPLDLAWHFLVVTFASDGSHGGVLSIYIDGALTGQGNVTNVGVAGTSPLNLGSATVALDLWSLCLYSLALSAAECQCSWETVTQAPGLVASYCFMQSPPSDVSGNNHPIVFTGIASEWITAPGVALVNNAYCVPTANEGVNPGGAGTDPYTIQAWIYVDVAPVSAASMYIFANGLVDSSCVSVFLQGDPSSDMYTLRATHGADSVAASDVIDVRNWHNVAVTFDGQTLTLYVDGAVAGSTVCTTTMPALQPNLAIGAGMAGADPAPTNFFTGYIQSVDVYASCLSSADISTYMLTDPYDVASCVAIYMLYEQPENSITDNPITLCNGAFVAETAIPPPSQIADRYAQAQRVRPVRESTVNLLPVSQHPNVAVQALSRAQLDRIIVDFESMLPTTLDAATRVNTYKTFVSRLETLNDQVASSSAPLPGTIVHARVGDEYVFYHYRADGVEECLRLPAATTDECTLWHIRLIVSILTGMLGVFGVRFTSTRVTAAIARQISRNTRLGRAVAETLNEECTVRTLIAALAVLFTSGALTSALSQAFANLSWWDFVFIVAAVILQFIEIIFPNPSSAAFYTLMLVRMGLLLFQINDVLSDKPADCGGSSSQPIPIAVATATPEYALSLAD